VLGTVQFGVPYGRRRSLGTMRFGSVARILDAAWDRGVRAFDTAEAYGLAAPRLARWLHARAHVADASVVTKVRLTDAAQPAAVRAAVARFAECQAVTILSHGALDPQTWACYAEVVSAAGATAGQSVYTASEVTCAALAGAARVQAPANVFDLSAADAASAAGIPADLRSVFLQGVLLETPERAESRAPGAGALAAAVGAAAREADVDPAAALMAAVLHLVSARHRMVFGVDGADQLADVERAVSLDARVVDEFLRALDARRPQSISRCVLDPREWS